MSSGTVERWSISIEKDYLKFSAAHFLIFPDGSAERLHGHNYKVVVHVHTELDAHGLVVNFKDIKPMVHRLCDELDEHVLIPGRHPVLRTELTADGRDRKSTRLNSSHLGISYAVFCLKKKKKILTYTNSQTK